MKPRRVSIASAKERSRGTRRSATSAPGGVAFDPTEDDLAPARRSALPPWREHPFAILAGIALLAYVVGALALQAFVDVDLVRAWVTPRAAAALNRSVTIDEGTVGLFPRPSVNLANISVANLEGFDGPTLARLDNVRMDLAWLPLLVGRVRVMRLHLDGAALHLAIDENGRSNFGDLVPSHARSAGSSGRAPLAAALKVITVSNGSLTYFDALRSRSMAVTGGEARAELSRPEAGGASEARWLADVTLASDSLMVRAASLTDEIIRSEGPSGRIAVRGGTAGTVLLESGFLTLAGDTLQVEGRLAGLGGAQPSFALELTNAGMSARALAAAFPSDLRSSLLPRTEGTLGVSLRVEGGLASSGRPAVDGTVRLRDVTLRLRGEPIAEGVDGVVAVDAERITLDSLRGTFAGGAFRLGGVIARDERSTATIVAHANPNMDFLDALGLLPGDVTLSGSAHLDVSIAGPLESLDSLQVVGTSGFEGFQLQHHRLGAPLYVPAGFVSLSGRSVSWSELAVLLGTDRITTSGELENVAGFWIDEDGTPEIRARLAGPSLDLDAVFPPRPDSQPTYAELAFSHLSGRALQGRSASAIAGDLGFHRVEGMPLLGSLELRFDTLSQGEHRLEEVVATVNLTDSMVSVSDASFGAWGGRARGSLRVGIGSEPHQPFVLAMRVEDAAAATFFGDAAAGTETVRGTLDLDLDLTGSTDGRLLPVAESLRGNARLTLANGQVAGTGVNGALADFLESPLWTGIPFTRLALGVNVRDRVLEIRDGDLDGALVRIAFGGLVDFSGTADISLALSLPVPQLGKVSLRRTGIGPGVVEQLERAGRPLDLGLQLSGYLSAPTLEPNGANAVGGQVAGR